MVILEIDGQKYGAPSYLDETVTPAEYRHNLELLAKEIAETVFLHYGYTGYVESVAVEPDIPPAWIAARNTERSFEDRLRIAKGGAENA